MISDFPSLTGVMYMTLVAYAIRYFSYSFVYNPWFILPVQLLHGITYGLAWPMFTAFANSTAPKGMASTLQSIVACCFMGVGKSGKILILSQTFYILTQKTKYKL